MTPKKTPVPAESDPIMTVAMAKLEEVELAEAEAAAAQAEMDRQARQRQAAKAAAEQAVAYARDLAEARTLAVELPKLSREVKALGATVREAFDVMAGAFPLLLAADRRYRAAMERRGLLAHLDKDLRAIGTLAPFSGLDKNVLMLLDHAIKGQAMVEK